MSGKLISRRSLLRGVAATAGGMLLAACTPKEVVKEVPVKETVVITVKETAVPAPVAKPSGPVMVTQYMNANMFAEADAFVEGQAWTVHLPKFNKDNPDVQLRAEPISGVEFATKLPMMTQANELGNALMWMTGKPFGDFAREKLVLPLDDLAKEAGVDLNAIYDERALALNRFDLTTNEQRKGPLWSLPMMMNPGICVIGYNADMLAEAGADLPKDTWTYDDILAAAQKVAKPPTKWGLLYARGAKVHDIASDYSYIAPHGGYIFDREGKKAMVNTPGSMEGWQFYYDLIFTYKVAPTIDDYNAFGDYKQAHMAGKLAMFREGPWGAMHFKLIPEEGKPGHVKAGIIPVPVGKSGRPGNTISTDSWGISANATDPMACFKALLWMTNTEAGMYRARGANMGGATKDFFGNEEALADPFISVTVKALAGAELPYVTANGRNKEVGDLLVQTMALIDGGTQKVTQSFFDELNQTMQDILDKPPA